MHKSVIALLYLYIIRLSIVFIARHLSSRDFFAYLSKKRTARWQFLISIIGSHPLGCIALPLDFYPGTNAMRIHFQIRRLSFHNGHEQGDF